MDATASPALALWRSEGVRAGTVLPAAAIALMAAMKLGATDALDARVAYFFRLHGSAEGRVAASEFVRLGDVRPALLLCGAGGLLAVMLARPAAAVAAGFVVVGSTATGVALETAIDRQVIVPGSVPPVGGFGSAPSNHLLLFASILGAGLLLVPIRWRAAWIGLAILACLMMSLSLLQLESHLFTDLLASVAVAAAWTAVGTLVARALTDRLPARLGPLPLRRSRGALALTTGGALIAGLLSMTNDGLRTPEVAGTLLVPFAGVALSSLVIAVGVRLRHVRSWRAEADDFGSGRSPR